MSELTMTPLLRGALRVDALASALVGLPMAAAAHPLAAALGLPAPLLFWAGIICLPYAVVLAVLSQSATLHTRAVGAIVIGNALWVLACLLIAFAGWLLPTSLGIVFLLAQAGCVALFAELQWLGARRARVAIAQ